MTTLDDIVQRGNRRVRLSLDGRPAITTEKNVIRCADGFAVSVIAGWGTYCRPRPGWGDVDLCYAGPYTHVEVGFPTVRPEPWDQWVQYCDNPGCPTDTVYDSVPVPLVRALIAAHGGEAPARRPGDDWRHRAARRAERGRP